MNAAKNDTPADKGLPRPPPKRRCSRVVLPIIIFVAGGLIGSGLTVIFRPEQTRRGRRSIEEIRDRMTEKIADKLDLSAQQTEQHRRIVEDRLKEWRKLFREIQPRLEKQAAILKANVAAMLNDEQKARWEQVYAERFNRWFPEPVSTQPATQPDAPAGSGPP